MALSTTSSRIKEKCGITGSAYDTTIANLISEMTPVVEYAIRDEHLADTGNVKLQDTLALGLTEIVCGELLEQLAREPGAMEHVRLGDFELWPPRPADWAAALSIKESGWSRLRPYLKTDPFEGSGKVSGSAIGKAGP